MWHFLARVTFFSAGTGGIFLLVVAVGAAYFVLSGNAYELLQNKG